MLFSLHAPNLLLLSLAGTAMTQQPPFLNMSLAPKFEQTKITCLSVRLAIERPNVGANETIISMDLAGPGFPVVQYSSDDIDASDADGKLPLAQADNDDTRNYIATRPTNGDVVLNFTATPDTSPNDTPLHDFRAEADGVALLGAGKSFLPVPKSRPAYAINLSWDLAKAPAGTRATSSCWGENAAAGAAAALTRVGSASSLVSNAYFAVGQMQSFPPPGTRSNYSMYWFDREDAAAPFNMTETAHWTGQLFEHMRRFFRDDDDSFRVFARRVPHASGGGAALTWSFLFNYGPDTTSKSLQNLLSHEMVHNWPTMTSSGGGGGSGGGNDDDSSLNTWYDEGAADYYSARLPFLFEMHTMDEFAAEMNAFARSYYSNPFVNVSNADQAQALDAASTAGSSEIPAALENLPYARGNMFLVRVDAAIRARSAGARSVDDVVLALVDRTRRGEGSSAEDFVDLLGRELGDADKARREYRDMVDGKLLVMPEGSLGACFAVQRTEVPVRSPDEAYGFETGGAAGSGGPMAVAYQWRRRPDASGEGCGV